MGGHHLLQLLKHCHFAYGVKILHIIKLLIIRCYDLCNLMHLYIHVDTGPWHSRRQRQWMIYLHLAVVQGLNDVFGTATLGVLGNPTRRCIDIYNIYNIQYTYPPHVDINLQFGVCVCSAPLPGHLSSPILVHFDCDDQKCIEANLQGFEFDAQDDADAETLGDQKVIEFMTFRFPKSVIGCLLHMARAPEIPNSKTSRCCC